MRSILAFGIVALAIPLMGFAQSFEPLDVNGKLDYHINSPLARWRSSGMRRTQVSFRRPIPRRNGDRRVRLR